MKKTQAFALVAVLVTGLFAGLTLNGAAFNSTLARQTDKPAGERWEYCAITDVPAAFGQEGKVIGSAKVCYFEGAGCRGEEVEASLPGYDLAEVKKAALAKAASKLGAEGWELLGDATQFGSSPGNVDPKALYFRRRRR